MPIQLPIGAGSHFKGIVDLVRMVAVVWEDEGLGANYHDEDIPADMVDQAKEYRDTVVEAAVELDDDVYGRLSRRQGARRATLKRCIRKAVLTAPSIRSCAARRSRTRASSPCSTRWSTICPRRWTSRRPRASTSGPEKSRAPAVDDEPLSVLAFKIMDDPFVGSLTFCRIYSGKLETGMGLLNSTRDKRERVGRMLLMHSNNREDIKEAYAGDIVALAGLKDTRTGDTLCDPQKQVILEKMEFPDPVIEIAIEPKSKADQEKLGVALAKLAAEDPSFRVSTDQESARPSSRAWASCTSTSRSTSSSAPTRSTPISARRRSPTARSSTKQVDIDYTHKKQTGGTGQFARVKIMFEPLATGLGLRVRSKVVGGTVPKESFPASKRASNRQGKRPSGRLPGDRLQGHPRRRRLSRRRLLGAGLRNRGARGASAKALQKDASELLEPIMKVEVVTPDEYTGSSSAT